MSYAQAAGLAALAALLTAARPIVYSLPEEVPAALPPGPDVARVQADCAACHSLDYITTQPRGNGPQFWRDSIAKMINVYRAPIDRGRREDQPLSGPDLWPFPMTGGRSIVNRGAECGSRRVPRRHRPRTNPQSFVVTVNNRG